MPSVSKDYRGIRFKEQICVVYINIIRHYFQYKIACDSISLCEIVQTHSIILCRGGSSGFARLASRAKRGAMRARTAPTVMQ